jgi:hypothetical protein
MLSMSSSLRFESHMILHYEIGGTSKLGARSKMLKEKFLIRAAGVQITVTYGISRDRMVKMLSPTRWQKLPCVKCELTP